MVNDTEAAIYTHGLSKRYPGQAKFSLKGLDLKIMPGEVYGFLGPNGAGKTTTIRLLMNFIGPTAGRARILGLDAARGAVEIKKHLGYLPGEIALYPRMSGRQFLDYMADLRPAKAQTYQKELARRFDVPLNRKISDLSKGNRQKLAVIQALASEPEVLVLDEPTSGLDPLMQEAFYEEIRAARGRGATIFLSSHDLSEVQKICDRVGFIRGGRLIAEQTIGELSKSAVQTYHLSFAEDSPLAELKGLKGVKVTANTPRHVTVRIAGDLRPLLNLLAKYNLNSIDRQAIDLEDEFLNYYKGAKS